VDPDLIQGIVGGEGEPSPAFRMQEHRPRDHKIPPAEWQSHLDMLDAQDPSFRD
jgi:hypothetical protein